MNIREAKDEIKKTVEIYLDKNEFGEYTLPVSKQRPVFMLGAPGIGKTEAVRQIAAELDIAFVPCSMTHYTRQGILGRSVAGTRDYEGRKAVVSEYTMGRVIAAVYNVMQDSGKKKGSSFWMRSTVSRRHLCRPYFCFCNTGFWEISICRTGG